MQAFSQKLLLEYRKQQRFPGRPTEPWKGNPSGGHSSDARRTPAGASPPPSHWPSSMNTTRVATSRAKPISWVTTTMVIPSPGQLLHNRPEPRPYHLRVQRSWSARRTASHPGSSQARAQSRYAAAGRRRAARDKHLPYRGDRHAPAVPALSDLPRSCVIFPRSTGASVMFWRTVLCGNRLNCWNTIPMR